MQFIYYYELSKVFPECILWKEFLSHIEVVHIRNIFCLRFSVVGLVYL